MIDARKPVTNPELVAAMEAMRDNGSKKNQDNFLVEMKKAHFLSHIISTESAQGMSGKTTVMEGTGISFELLESADGTVCIPVFTDWEQLEKWKKVADQQTIVININDLNYMVTSNPKISGFVINPFGHCVMFTEEMIQILLKLEGKAPGSIYGGAGQAPARSESEEAQAGRGDRMSSAATDLDDIFGSAENRRAGLSSEEPSYQRRDTFQSLEEKYRQERAKARLEPERSAMEASVDMDPGLGSGRKNDRSAKGLQEMAFEVYDDSDVQIGDPKFYPHELVDCVSYYLKKQRQVKAVYLKLMEREGEKSFLFIVDFSGDRQNVFSGIAEAAAPYLKGMYLDMVPFDSDFGQKAVEESKPFYTKKKFGLF